MAALAMRAEASAMGVIRGMAGDAGKRKFLRLRALAMTSLADEVFVAALQCKICLCSMIELPKRPAIGVMAFGAGRSQRSLVRVVRQMTIGAASAGVLEGNGHMTGFARRACMKSQQWKAA